MTGSDSSAVRVLLIGGGGREHAIAWAVAKSPRCADLVVAPGNACTPGRRADVRVDDPDAIVALARRERADLVILGPDESVAAGVADALDAAGIAVFGATKAASRLEWSKSWARSFAQRHGIPGPVSATFTAAQLDAATAYARAAGKPLVVKADGLAAGKGVVVPHDVDSTVAAIRSALVDASHAGTSHAAAGSTVVLEELLVGEEVSLLAFCDGEHVVAMPPAQDHKHIGEGDRGLNTGGMGAYAPAPVCPPALAAELTDTFLRTAVAASAAEGHPYRGVLYAGLMLTADGPRLIEFNCRFGDPEAQVLLPLLDTDLVEVALACAQGRLAQLDVNWKPGAACAVVLAAPGYPSAPTVGAQINVSTGTTPQDDTGMLFWAGVTRTGDGLVTSGGRVVAATGIGDSIIDARTRAYDLAGTVSFDGMQMRRDIAWRALARTTGGYAESGVSIDEGARAVDLLAPAVERTHGPSVLAGVGAFGGAFDASALTSMRKPVLVASTDGVGTKVALATEAGRIGTVGADLVNHCVNDVLVQNARPLFFLDYVASSKIVPEEIAAVVGSMASACADNACALLGGETAEMPGVYHDGHLDVAGTLVGVVEAEDLLPRPGIAEGDVLVGIASSGPHTNGYSLLRKVFAGLPLDAMPAPLERPLGDALLEPHRSYLPVLRSLLDGDDGDAVLALVHITGGGLIENVPRVLPSGLGANITLGSWPVPPLFRLIRDASALPAEELHRTLNMGIGMVVVCRPVDVPRVQARIAEPTWTIGTVVATGDGHVGPRVQLR